MMNFKPLYVAILALSYQQLALAQSPEELPELESLQIQVEKEQGLQSLPFAESQKASDMVIKKEKLQGKSATLGNALAGERGIHSNPFGGGASAPIIRGQEGVRVKILQNGTDVVDMSSVSPDHAVAADSLLSEQIELVRGSSTLLYATASQAGVVNVIDKRIPSSMPSKAHDTELFTRYNANSNEKLATLGSTIALGQNVAVRVEGLTRKADNYAVPNLIINAGDDPVKKLPDSYNQSKVGTLGLSWIGNQGYIGASVSQRKDKYGLVGHNHQFDHCAPHVLRDYDIWNPAPEYLSVYPHLMKNEDVSQRLHEMHCGNDHAENEEHSHNNVYGHKHDYGEKGPWVDLLSTRYDLRGEWQNPFAGIDKLRLSGTYSKYHHDERGDGKAHLSDLEKKQVAEGFISSTVNQRLKSAEFYKNNPESIYDNKGLNTRLDIFHKPIGDVDKWGELKGSWGVQYQTQTSNVKRPFHVQKITDDISHTYGERQSTGRTPLIENTNKQLSFFGVEQYRFKNWTFEAGVRSETQTVKIDYDEEKLAQAFAKDGKRPDTTPNKQRALSYSAGILWDFKPNYRLSLGASHNERIATPMELYYHGKHLATNSYQYGNPDLEKEQSNNFEIGLMYKGDKWDYKLSTYFNDFKNYINNENLYREGNLFQRRYTQYPANIYGVEGEISYRFTPEQQVTVYGDYVRGKLKNLPSIYGDMLYSVGYDCYDAEWDEDVKCALGLETIERPDRNAPRMPPARLGLTWASQWNERWSSNLDMMRVFPQHRTSTAIWVKEKSRDELEDLPSDQPKLNIYPIPEDKTAGYTMLNLGVDYKNQFKDMEYKISFNANNLLDEKVYIHNSYLPYVPQMGRNLSLAVQLKF